MEKEFVPYELAVKLKALGFDEPCFGWFTDSEHLYIDKIINGKMFKSDNGCLAPTLSQAFRFFREKYGLQYDITLSVGDNNQLVGFYMLIDKFNPLWNEDESIELEVTTTDRDEAELAVLTKLIEIVENI